jgi:hypothetical protein
MGRIKLTKTELRRLRVAELLAAQPGISERALAGVIGCAQSTVHADIVAIRQAWQARRRDLYEQRVAEDLARTDAAIAAIWPKVLGGNGPAIDRLVTLLTYRARVLGIETQRHELDIGEVLAGYLDRCAGDERDPLP